MDFKKLKTVFVAAFLLMVVAFLAGCSENNTDDDTRKFDRDIAYARTIPLDLSAFEREGSRLFLQDIKWHKGKIYAALHYLDISFQPTASSLILEIDETGNILRNFESNFMNVEQIQIRNNNLFVLDMGVVMDENWSNPIDGGITRIDLASGQITTVLDAKDVGADPQQIEFISDSEAYLLLYRGWGDAFVVRFNVDNGNVGENIGINAVSAISYNAYTNALWIAGDKIFKYSGGNVVFDTTSRLPTRSITSAGGATLTTESDFSSGYYGVIYDLGLSTTPIKYYEKGAIHNDAQGNFVDGNFFILENGNDNLIFLTADGDAIRKLPLKTSNVFNHFSVSGNGNGDIFVGSKNDLTIAVFRVSEK